MYAPLTIIALGSIFSLFIYTTFFRPESNGNAIEYIVTAVIGFAFFLLLLTEMRFLGYSDRQFDLSKSIDNKDPIVDLFIRNGLILRRERHNIFDKIRFWPDRSSFHYIINDQVMNKVYIALYNDNLSLVISVSRSARGYIPQIDLFLGQL
jgi:hypothetical protein